MTILGVYPTDKPFGVVDALIVALIAILIVFAALIVIILICSLVSKGVDKAEERTMIKPRPENKILEEDEDAVVAALVATIDFNKEFKKDAHLVSIKKIGEE